MKFKIISVGKTSLANRISKNIYNAHYKSTSGFDMFSAEVDLGNRKVGFNIIDTAGQERYHAITNNFYRGADAVILCFDITNEKSFECVEWWKNNFLTSANPQNPDKYPFFLVGTKVDLENRAVDLVKCEQWCKLNNNAPFVETSAKADIGVKELFKTIAEHLIERRPHESGRLNSTIPNVYHSSVAEPRKGCCG